uniref:Uncharacterized protein n=1 Tax=Anopheles culicifacies TaxID=139723 RepID=A0A182MHS6_9DIPT
MKNNHPDNAGKTGVHRGCCKVLPPPGTGGSSSCGTTPAVESFTAAKLPQEFQAFVSTRTSNLSHPSCMYLHVPKQKLWHLFVKQFGSFFGVFSKARHQHIWSRSILPATKTVT